MATTDDRSVSFDLDDGRVLSARRSGAATPRIAFVHGAGLNAHTWDRTIAALDAPALALDLPGHGDSSWRDDADYSADALAPDIARALETWTSTPVVLVGHSLGGLASIVLARDRPDLVAHLVLVDVLPEIESGGLDMLRAFYARLEFASLDDALDHVESFGLGGSRQNARRGIELNTRLRADGALEWKHHMARILSPSAADTSPRARAVTREELAAVAAPVSLVAGTRGFLGESALAAFRDARGDDALTVLDAPHNVQETHSADLASLVRSLAPTT
ncbi:alpha/beta hydrolase [Microbacterium faecale]|uniref:Alpha/beta hydrolase n=1 Tax=Microbacterium faecale TaxID=1804630 RepID=A0A916Y815_9MICO|nr:alpha/beta hydrolase [Microbacterium faecale]GGD34141.1 alpha/beta hydrolase [Microbacterium faecale]